LQISSNKMKVLGATFLIIPEQGDLRANTWLPPTHGTMC
jgi:hypothetical protein